MRLTEEEKKIIMAIVSLIYNIPRETLQQLQDKLLENLENDDGVVLDGEKIEYKMLYCYRLCRKKVIHIKLKQETDYEQYYVCLSCGNIKIIQKV